jgi:nitrous-oxide reductase
MELPPYWQDLCDAGKLVSDGWVFCNSFNTEMATGGVEQGNPPFESGRSARTIWTTCTSSTSTRPIEVAQAGNTTEISGFPVISLETAIARAAVLHARAQEPARRRRHPGGEVHRRLRQARSPHHHLQL